jgi:hypothetical protein
LGERCAEQLQNIGILWGTLQQHFIARHCLEEAARTMRAHRGSQPRLLGLIARTHTIFAPSETAALHRIPDVPPTAASSRTLRRYCIIARPLR